MKQSARRGYCPRRNEDEMLIQQTYKGSFYPLTPKYIINSEIKWFQPVGRVGDTPYIGQYKEALPKSGIQDRYIN